MDNITKLLVFAVVFSVIFLIASVIAEALERHEKKTKESGANRCRRGRVKRALDDDIKYRYIDIAKDYAEELKENRITDALCAAAAYIDSARKKEKGAQAERRSGM